MLDADREHDAAGAVAELLREPPQLARVALAANPRVVSRLTGAEPAAVRAAAVHGTSPAEVPPAEETLAAIAAAMGIDGAVHGWSDAPDLAGAVRIDR